MGPVFSSTLSRCHDDACEKKRRGGEAERGGERRSNRLHVRRYCYRYAPLLHVRVGTRPSLAASAKSRSATLAGGVERERERRRENALTTFFFFFPSLSSLPFPSHNSRRRKLRRNPSSPALLFCPRERPPAEPTATLFSFPSTLLQLGIITRARTSSYVRAYRRTAASVAGTN